MPTRKYNKSKKKTVKRRKNKGGGGNFSRPKPSPTPTPTPTPKKRVTFPDDDSIFTIKNISPRTVKNDEEDEKKNGKTKKKKWKKMNTTLQTKGKKEISFNDYTKKLNRILKEKEAEEKTEIDTFLANQKNSINTKKNKLAPLTLDEQLTIHIREDKEKKAAKKAAEENEKKQSEHT